MWLFHIGIGDQGCRFSFRILQSRINVTRILDCGRKEELDLEAGRIYHFVAQVIGNASIGLNVADFEHAVIRYTGIQSDSKYCILTQR